MYLYLLYSSFLDIFNCYFFPYHYVKRISTMCLLQINLKHIQLPNIKRKKDAQEVELLSWLLFRFWLYYSLWLALCNVMTKSKMLLPGHILHSLKRLNITGYLIFLPGVKFKMTGIRKLSWVMVELQFHDSIMLFHLWNGCGWGLCIFWAI